MPRKSSISRLDPRIREAVDAAVRDGRATIDEIAALIGEMGGNASRSAVGRYAQKASERFEKYREAQEVARVWLRKLEEEPDGDVARLLPEMLRLLSYRTMEEMTESQKAAKAMDIMLLGKAMDHIAKAEKSGVDRVLKIRQQERERAAGVVDEVAKAQGMDDKQAKFWRQKVLTAK